jgi:pimeloyl-ACP methyl ester carboxylesterase
VDGVERVAAAVDVPLRSVDVGPATFTYAEAGSGRALVLLHGIGSGARSWKHQLADLSPNFRVVAWDAPGYGGSTPLGAEHPDASDYAAALVALLDALAIDRLNLVGHSLGTVTALRFALEHPDRVSSLTLASPSSGHARLDPDERQRLRDARLGDLEALGPAAMARKRGPRLLSAAATPAQVEAVVETMGLIRPDGYRQAVWMLSSADTAADLASLPPRVPVQIVYGAADVVTTPQSIAGVAGARPDAPLREIPDAGHAVYLEQPQRFNAIVRDWAEAER